VVGEGPQPAIQRRSFLPMDELEFAIVRMSHDARQMPACHAFCAYFGATPLAPDIDYSDREAGNPERNGGTFFAGNDRMNEITHPSESMGLERSSSSNGAP